MNEMALQVKIIYISKAGIVPLSVGIAVFLVIATVTVMIHRTQGGGKGECLFIVDQSVNW